MKLIQEIHADLNLIETTRVVDPIYLENAVLKRNRLGHTAGNRSEKPIILAVDDKPALLTTVVKMLSEHFTVIAVTSGEAALKAMEKYTPVLFLLDIEMPGMDGYALAALIRKNEKCANIPIIFLSAQSKRDDVMTAMAHGGNDYIVKPVDKEMLYEKIRRQLE